MKITTASRIDQIEMAANGCVSGTLSEWPFLKEALEYYGVQKDSSTTANELTEICNRLLLSGDCYYDAMGEMAEAGFIGGHRRR